MGLEGIVSKRTDAPYRSGPSKAWLKTKNPASEAVRREREEEWQLDAPTTGRPVTVAVWIVARRDPSGRQVLNDAHLMDRLGQNGLSGHNKRE